MRDLTTGICGILCRGAGSRLHGNMKVSAHLRFFLSNFFAEYQSREHATKNLARRRSWRVLRLWHLRHGHLKLSRVNALGIAGIRRMEWITFYID